MVPSPPLWVASYFNRSLSTRDAGISSLIGYWTRLQGLHRDGVSKVASNDINSSFLASLNMIPQDIITTQTEGLHDSQMSP